MNNSFPRVIDGMCATLRTEVLPRLDDEFARGQVFGVINLLNTFKVRADWSPGFLLQQLDAQRAALEGVAALVGTTTGAPAVQLAARPENTSAPDLLAMRDANNAAIGTWLEWLAAGTRELPAGIASQAEEMLRAAMRAELDIELKNSPRPLFAEMSSGRED